MCLKASARGRVQSAKTCTTYVLSSVPSDRTGAIGVVRAHARKDITVVLFFLQTSPGQTAVVIKYTAQTCPSMAPLVLPLYTHVFYEVHRLTFHIV